MSVDVLKVVVICKSETSQSVIVIVVCVECRNVVSALLKIFSGNNQKVVYTLRDRELYRVDSDALNLGWREVYIEILEVCIVDVEYHLGKSRILFCS